MEQGGAGWRSSQYDWDSREVRAEAKPEPQAAEAAPTERKRRRRFKNDSCQVPGCSNPLQLQYHKKYHVCAEHFRSPCLTLDGMNCRFCQKCGRFQPLDAFDDTKRTCRIALETHNARRRKRDAAKGGGSAGGGGASGSPRSAGSGSGASGQEGRSNSAGASGNSASPTSGAAPSASQKARPSLTASPAAPAAGGSPAVRAGSRAPPSQPPQLPSRPTLAAASASPAARPSSSPLPPQPGSAGWQPGGRLAPEVEELLAVCCNAGFVPPLQQPWDGSRPGAVAGEGRNASNASTSMAMAGPFGGPTPLSSMEPWHHGSGGARAGSLPHALQGNGLGAPPADLLAITSHSSGSVENPLTAEAMGLPMPAHPSSQPELRSSGGYLLGSSSGPAYGQPAMLGPASSALPTPEAGLHFGGAFSGYVPTSSQPLQTSAGMHSQQHHSHHHHQQQQQALQGFSGLQGQAGLAPGLGGGAGFGGYEPDSVVHRMSIKIFRCAPDQLSPEIRAELESVLHVAPKLVESFIRPGCTHLTVDLRLRRGEAPSAAAAHLLHALRNGAAFGAAAGNAAQLQWAGQLAAVGPRPADPSLPVQLPEQRLRLEPACIAVPAPGQPWPMVQLELEGAAGWAGAAHPLALCRQSGRHLAVSVWTSPDAAAAEAQLSLAQAAQAGPLGAAGQADDGSASDGGLSTASSGVGSLSGASTASEDPSVDDTAAEMSPAASADFAASAAALPAGTTAALPGSVALWARPVGLRPGSCEFEVELRLPLGAPAGASQAAAGGNHTHAFLLSTPAPLLVLRDAEAAAEVQALLAGSGGALWGDDFLRDVGLAAAYLEELREAHASPAPARRRARLPPAAPLPPAVAAEAAFAALGFARGRGMPALEAMLQRAHAAAAAAMQQADCEPSSSAAAAAAAAQAAAWAEEAGPATAKPAAAEPAAKARSKQGDWEERLQWPEEESTESDSEREGEPTSLTEEAAMLVKAMMSDVESLHVEAEGGFKARFLLPLALAPDQALPVQAMMRLAAAMAAFFAAVLLARTIGLSA